MDRACHARTTSESVAGENAPYATGLACLERARDRKATAADRPGQAFPPPACWLVDRHRKLHRARLDRNASRAALRSDRASLRDPAPHRPDAADRARDLAGTADRTAALQRYVRRMRLRARREAAHCGSIQRHG